MEPGAGPDAPARSWRTRRVWNLGCESPQPGQCLLAYQPPRSASYLSRRSLRRIGRAGPVCRVVESRPGRPGDKRGTGGVGRLRSGVVGGVPAARPRSRPRARRPGGGECHLRHRHALPALPVAARSIAGVARRRRHGGVCRITGSEIYRRDRPATHRGGSHGHGDGGGGLRRAGGDAGVRASGHHRRRFPCCRRATPHRLSPLDADG